MQHAAAVRAELASRRVWWGLAVLVWLPALLALGAWSLAQPTSSRQLIWAWAAAGVAACVALASMRRVGTGELTASAGRWIWRQGARVRNGRVLLRADVAGHVLLEFRPTDGPGSERAVWMLACPRGGEGVAWRRALVADAQRTGRIDLGTAGRADPPAGAAP